MTGQYLTKLNVVTLKIRSGRKARVNITFTEIAFIKSPILQSTCRIKYRQSVCRGVVLNLDQLVDRTVGQHAIHVFTILHFRETHGQALVTGY